MVKPVLSCIIILALIVSLLFSFGCVDNKSGNFLVSSSGMPQVKMGYQKGPISTLAIIAKEKGFFEKEGVFVEMDEFSAGKLAFQAFLGGSVDFALVGDLPVAMAKAQGNDFVVVSQVISKTHNENRIIALKDSDASSAQDYFAQKHRTVATFIGGTAEFYLYEFLRYNKISGKNFPDIVSAKPEDMVATLASGSVDAISIFEPYPTIAEHSLEGKTLSFTLPESEYNTMYVLTVHRGFAQNNPEVLKRILRALVDAQDFVAANPSESKSIIARATKFDSQSIEAVWGAYEFKLALDKDALQNTWRNEINWAVSEGKLPKSTVMPDFNELIFNAPFKEVISGR